MPKTALPEYEGLPVRKLGIEVRNTAGGLQKAMKVETQPIRPGETRYVVYEVAFEAFRHDPMDDGEAWELVAIGKASSAAFLDRDLVRDAIDETNRRIIEVEDAEKGREQLSPEAARMVEHDQGLHKRRRKNCPACYPDDAVEPGEPTPIGRARSASKRARKS